MLDVLDVLDVLIVLDVLDVLVVSVAVVVFTTSMLVLVSIVEGIGLLEEMEWDVIEGAVEAAVAVDTGGAGGRGGAAGILLNISDTLVGFVEFVRSNSV